MSSFFSTGLNKKIDALMDRLFGAGIASHATIIEQINYLMFLRALTVHDDEAKLLNPDHEVVFTKELSKYRWDNLLMMNAEVLFDTLEEAYRKLPELTQDKIVKLLFRNAHIKIYDKPTLRVLVHEIEKLVTELDNEARHGEKDIFGDMYEYLLSKLAQAGTNGQFRTPRHIIKFIVDVVDPEKNETILDPACGTAGFLVAAFDHLKHKYTSERFIKDGAFPMDKLTSKERDFIFNHVFNGFDSDEDMVKFGIMNLYLHSLGNANIKRQNTLVDTAGDRTKWDIVLANPPFAGKLEAESISEDLRMGTRSTEVLFVRYMIDHLSPEKGKAGIIVPEGIIFQSTNAHKQLRQKLIDAGLWCVVSLPSGVFQPYAGVKTSILFIDKQLAAKFNRIMFITINSDGFELNANRRPTAVNDLPNALRLINYCKEEINVGHIRDNYYFPFEDADRSISIAPLHYSFEKVERITDESDLTLQSSHYKDISEPTTIQQWPMVKLADIAVAFNGKTFKKDDYQSKGELRTIKVKDYDENGVYFERNENGWVNSKIPSEKLLQKGDTLVINAAHNASHVAGKIGYLSFDPPVNACTSGEVMVIRANERISPLLLNYLIKADKVRKQLKELVKGIHLYPKDVLQVNIPLPPIEIQKQIVADIDGYQKIIDSAQQIVSNWNTCIQQIINNWKAYIKASDKVKLVKLSDKNLFEIQSGGTPKTSVKEYWGGDILWVTLADLSPLDFYSSIVNTQRTITKKGLLKSSAKIVPANTILISTRATIGRVGYAKKELATNQGFKNIIIKDMNKILPEYLLVIATSLKYELEALASGGTFKEISKTNFERIDIPLPEINQQKQIIRQIESALEILNLNKQLVEIYREKINKKLDEIWNE